MSETAVSYGAARAEEPGVSDYLALLKPRVMSLVVFTAGVGMVAAPGGAPAAVMLAGLVCIAIGAGASGALNMWWDADIDAMMARTARRPIPRGRIAPGEAAGFGATLAAGSVLAMAVLVNWTAAALLALTILFYLVVYTMWLKRRTPQNIVIGGAAGAFPPMIGWAVATGEVALASIALFLIIFFWTPPHFWALALWRDGDYARAGVPMLPVAVGRAETRAQIVVYSWIMAAVALSPLALGLGGAIYGLAALGAGGWFLWLAHRVRALGEVRGERPAKRLFAFSILYLFLLFAALFVESAFGLRWALV